MPAGVGFGGPAWWDEMGRNAADEGHDPHSAAWYRSMLAQYVARFPDADARSLENMRSFVVQAERRESGGSA